MEEVSEKRILEILNVIVKSAKTEFSTKELKEISIYAIQTANGSYAANIDLHESDWNHVKNEMKESNDIRDNIKRVVVLRLLKDCGLYTKFTNIKKQ